MSSVRLTFIVISLFLLFTGLLYFFPVLESFHFVIYILAVFSGVMIIFDTPKVSNFVGWVLAAIFLLFTGLRGLIDIDFTEMRMIMATLSIGAGLALLITWPGFHKRIGFILFCLWLILTGLTGFISIGDYIMAIPIIGILSGLLMIIHV